MKMKHCPYCDRKVSVVRKKFSWFFFLATCWCGIGEVYLIIHLLKRKKICSICGCKI